MRRIQIAQRIQGVIPGETSVSADGKGDGLFG